MFRSTLFCAFLLGLTATARGKVSSPFLTPLGAGFAAFLAIPHVLSQTTDFPPYGAGGESQLRGGGESAEAIDHQKNDDQKNDSIDSSSRHRHDQDDAGWKAPRQLEPLQDPLTTSSSTVPTSSSFPSLSLAPTNSYFPSLAPIMPGTKKEKKKGGPGGGNPGGGGPRGDKDNLFKKGDPKDDKKEKNKNKKTPELDKTLTVPKTPISSLKRLPRSPPIVRLERKRQPRL
jgi:hypothetical protein